MLMLEQAILYFHYFCLISFYGELDFSVSVQLEDI